MTFTDWTEFKLKFISIHNRKYRYCCYVKHTQKRRSYWMCLMRQKNNNSRQIVTDEQEWQTTNGNMNNTTWLLLNCACKNLINSNSFSQFHMIIAHIFFCWLHACNMVLQRIERKTNRTDQWYLAKEFHGFNPLTKFTDEINEYWRKNLSWDIVVYVDK